MKAIRTTSFATVISITLILLVVGMMGKFFTYAYYFRDQVKQDVGFHVFLREGVDSLGARALMETLAERKEVKRQDFISKEEALKTFLKEGNEDPTRMLDYNPLPASIHIYIADTFVQRDKLSEFEAYLRLFPVVSDVKYAEDFVEKININVKRFTIAMAVVIAILLFISIILIDNTIRLNMLNNRFAIKTMQYAGASHRFIAMPYIRKGIYQGILSGLIAAAMVAAFNRYLQYVFPELARADDYKKDLLLFLGIIALGACLAFFSTLFSVFKYLKSSISKLYRH